MTEEERIRSYVIPSVAEESVPKNDKQGTDTCLTQDIANSTIFF